MNSPTISQELQNELLAQGIPALSPPCGAGNVVYGLHSENMHNSKENKNEWVNIPMKKRKWLHSDIKNKAFYYIHSFFPKLIE